MGKAFTFNIQMIEPEDDVNLMFYLSHRCNSNEPCPIEGFKCPFRKPCFKVTPADWEAIVTNIEEVKDE